MPNGRCDRLARALRAWVSLSLHRRRFPQAVRYGGQRTHSEPARHSSPGLKFGVFWRRTINCPSPVLLSMQTTNLALQVSALPAKRTLCLADLARAYPRPAHAQGAAEGLRLLSLRQQRRRCVRSAARLAV